MTAPHPIYLPHNSRRDEAITAGYAPHADDRLPPAEHLRAAEGVDVLEAFAAEVRNMIERNRP